MLKRQELRKFPGQHATAKLYPRVSALRKAGVITTRSNPNDDRQILVSSESLDVIRRAVGREDNA